MTITYRRNQSLLQAIAKRKYHARHFEIGNTIVVRLDDVNAQLAALREAEDATARKTNQRQDELREAG
jgi:hypothetical protein